MKVNWAALTALWTRCSSPSLSTWEIRLFIFSNKKLVFRRWSLMNHCIFVVSNGAASLHTTNVSGLLPSETWRAEIVYTLSADLHLCICSQSPLKKTNGSLWVTGYCTELASLRFWVWESLLCSSFMLCRLFPALISHIPAKLFLCVFSQREMPPLLAPDPCGPLPPSQLGEGISCAGSWSSLSSSHVSFANSKHGEYHCWIHTQTANKHPHPSPPRKDVITHFPSFSLLNVAYLWGKAQVGTVKAAVWGLFTLSTMKLLSYQSRAGWTSYFFKTFLW